MENLIFISGIGKGRSTYNELFSLAPKNWKLHFISSTFTMGNGPAEAIERIEDYAGKSNLKNVIIAGHSLGGGLAILYANKYPNRVKQLYLLDTIGINEKRSLLSDILRFLHPRPVCEALADLKATTAAIRYPVLFFKLARYIRKIDLQKNAESIVVPTVIIWGENDQMIPVNHARILSNLIKNSKLIIIPKVGHDWPIYNPQLLWSNI